MTIIMIFEYFFSFVAEVKENLNAMKFYTLATTIKTNRC